MTGMKGMKGMKALRFGVPLALFMAMLFFLWKGLALDPHSVPSPLIDKPAPVFTLPMLNAPGNNFSSTDLRGKVWLLNVWGSWCGSCRAEHPLLVALAQNGSVPIYGLNWKDTHDDATQWLARSGDPYTLSVADADGRVAIDFGVYGAPETFVIDKQGIIRYKQVGPLTPEAINDIILPLVKRLQR